MTQLILILQILMSVHLTLVKMVAFVLMASMATHVTVLLAGLGSTVKQVSKVIQVLAVG